ncbi:MAG: calcium/sodium antiporter [Bacteroidales bacterium]|jgi:cation:H+ antiporter|nr:calcium/sodium antiporter [Bacteroidales bacterium]
MIFQLGLLIIGFVILIKSADWMVDGASNLAKKYNISDLAIGLTVVAFGTSAPELVVNSVAAFQNHPDIVFGNIIGSNNMNIYIVLGLAGIISPLAVQSCTVWKEIPISLLAIIVLFLFTNEILYTNNQLLTRWEGFVLLIFFVLFLLYVYKQLKTDTSSALETPVVKNMSLSKIWILIIIGISGLVIGGKLVVDNAGLLAVSLGISEKIIGLTVVAFGTSLPELATSVVAAIKKNNNIAVGNIIGSNIFNLFLILGVSAVIRPIKYSNAFNTDMLILTLGTFILFIAMFTGKRKKLDRWEAAIMLAVFIAYTIYLIAGEM